MNKKLFLSLCSALILISANAVADEKIVPLDMELGYWVTSTEIEESPMIKQMLANVPESQRAAIKQMIDNSMESAGTVKQCITAESQENMENKMREAFAQDNECELSVIKSTNEEFVGEFACGGQVQAMSIHTKVINSKRHESTMVSSMGGMGGMGENTIKTTAEWQSANCPAGVDS